ncbi:MAG: ABC transporter substrate-binding protein [Proteobacteria bacterium]|nr:ABC transporter substrate-binding protein [Pseudomonadota bacterium]
MYLLKIRHLIVHGIIIALALFWVIPVQAGLPTDQVKEKIDAIRKVLDDPGLKDRKAARMEFIMDVVDTMVDWQEATRRALGIHWKKRTPQEKEEFIALFRDLLKKTYSDKMDLYAGEEIVFDSEKIDEDYAIVKAKISNKKKGTDIAVDFRAIKKGDKWLTYDISAEGISVLNNYRVQFDEIIVSSSYEELVKKMKRKQGIGSQTPSKISKESRQ